MQACKDVERRQQPPAVLGSFDTTPVFRVSAGDSTDHSKRFVIEGPKTAEILDNGLVAVDNRRQIILLDSTGAARALLGGSGVGPGEFASIDALVARPGAIGGYSYGQSRVTMFEEPSMRPVSITLAERSGAFVVRWLPGAGPVVSSLERPDRPILFTVLDAAGSVVSRFSGPPPPASMRASGVLPGGFTVPLETIDRCDGSTLWTSVGSTVYYTDQRSGSIVAVHPNGSTSVVYRTPFRGLVTDAVRSYVRAQYAVFKADERRVDEIVENIGSLGEPLPFAWSRMLADQTGRLWLRLQTCTLPEAGVDNLWEVIDTAGVFMGAVRSNRLLMAVRGDRAIMLEQEPAGEYYVALYRVRLR